MAQPCSEPSTGVVVTGGASGIGLAIADALASVGRPVALWDREGVAAASAALRISGDHGVDAIGVNVDVTGVGDVLTEAVNVSRKAIGPIGGLVHAAAIVQLGSVDEIT
ncbi:MAG: SDR family NAD(P)-dependent oxidoreductase, partial [Acidimicrobiales bacterium]|nr:SDR family NAD(P)-dependent oxidoreductase [Acidimicrobiales bacterium]